MFLDDIRDPPSGEWFVARTCEEARNYCLELGHAPSLISFDHDLGVEAGEDGHEFAKWLVHKDLDISGFIPADFEFRVHSANPVGIANIEGLLRQYLGFRGP